MNAVHVYINPAAAIEFNRSVGVIPAASTTAIINDQRVLLCTPAVGLWSCRLAKGVDVESIHICAALSTTVVACNGPRGLGSGQQKKKHRPFFGPTTDDR